MPILGSLDSLRTRWLAVVAILLCGLGPHSAWAWGRQGHEIVALVADRLLTPNARARVAEILATEPGATLASISSWADETRSPATAAWHYVNLPRDACVYSQPRDCPTGSCVVEAIRAQAIRLSTAGSRAETLEALKYFVHLVADVHQPLHAGFADDRGGNLYQLQAFGRGTNLHAVWDTALLARINPNTAGLESVVDASKPAGASSTFSPEDWAAESCRIASRSDFYPGRQLSPSYVDAYSVVAIARLRSAGRRLAALLNATLSN